ncbi:MAG: paraquat-inducible protein A [Ostreibacterium sp.]
MTKKNQPNADLPVLFFSPSAKTLGYSSCLACGQLLPKTQQQCDICQLTVYSRKTEGLSSSVAYLLAAILLFFPANLIPIIKTTSLGATHSDTILSGIIYFWQTKSYFIAIVIFVASFITPLFKMLSMAYLCYTCYRQSTQHILFRSKLYHFTELIGRWSMIDVFVVALLGALVKMGSLASIEPQVGIVAFALVVFLTIFATEKFDTRLIWDSSKAGYEKQQCEYDRRNAKT